MGNNIYITDETAAHFGGTEAVQRIYDNIGEQKPILIVTSEDSEEDVRNAFRALKQNLPEIQASEESPPKTLSQIFNLDSSNEDHIVLYAQKGKDNIAKHGDMDNDGRDDFLLVKVNPETMDNGLFPGDPQTVKQFVLAHEIGHGHHTETTQPEIQRENESNADLLGLVGIEADEEFIQGVIAARTGHTLGGIILTEASKAAGNDLPDNSAFSHISTPYLLEKTGRLEIENPDQLENALTNFRTSTLGAVYDDVISKKPDSKFDVTQATQDENGAFKFMALNEMHGDITAAIEAHGMQNDQAIEQFTSNITQAISDSMEYKQEHGEPDPHEDSIYASEMQATLNYLKEEQPEIYKDIMAENFGAFASQNNLFADLENKEPSEVQNMMYHAMKTAEQNGEFEDRPIEQSLVNAAEQDRAFRPEAYGISPGLPMDAPAAKQETFVTP